MTRSQSTGVVERLRARKPSSPSYLYGQIGGGYVNPDGPEAADTIAALYEALGEAEVVIDYAASILWNCRPEGRRNRPARVDAALRKFRATLARTGSVS